MHRSHLHRPGRMLHPNPGRTASRRTPYTDAKNRKLPGIPGACLRIRPHRRNAPTGGERRSQGQIQCRDKALTPGRHKGGHARRWNDTPIPHGHPGSRSKAQANRSERPWTAPGKGHLILRHLRRRILPRRTRRAGRQARMTVPSRTRRPCTSTWKHGSSMQSRLTTESSPGWWSSRPKRAKGAKSHAGGSSSQWASRRTPASWRRVG